MFCRIIERKVTVGYREAFALANRVKRELRRDHGGAATVLSLHGDTHRVIVAVYTWFLYLDSEAEWEAWKMRNPAAIV